MSDPFPYPERPIDRVVRAKLDADAQSVDADHLLHVVRQRLANDVVMPSRRSRRWILAAAGALAASVLLVVFLLIPGGSMQASPRQMVERARAEHESPADRCYAVRAEILPELRKRFPKLDFDRESRVWTRGDRYFVVPTNGNGVWGRDEQNRVWFAPTPDAAARFDEDEVPSVFREFLKLRAVRLPELLDEVLADFDLSSASDVDESSDIRRIFAVARNNQSSLRMAVIDIEKETNVVRRLALDRQLFGELRAKVSVTFTLVDTTAQDPSRYGPEGHLKPGAPVYESSRPAMRLALMVRHLGPFKQD